jgi:triphosphoribosyl-dephospho-CoA synthase
VGRFSHVRRKLDVLARARVAGTPEGDARLDALLPVMSTLQDTGLLYTAGPHGLRHVTCTCRTGCGMCRPGLGR